MFASIVEWDNLWLAYRKAAKGKRGTGSAARYEVQVTAQAVGFLADIALEFEQSYRLAVKAWLKGFLAGILDYHKIHEMGHTTLYQTVV